MPQTHTNKEIEMKTWSMLSTKLEDISLEYRIWLKAALMVELVVIMAITVQLFELVVTPWWVAIIASLFLATWYVINETIQDQWSNNETIFRYLGVFLTVMTFFLAASMSLHYYVQFVFICAITLWTIDCEQTAKEKRWRRSEIARRAASVALISTVWSGLLFSALWFFWAGEELQTEGNEK